jgi:hypothetical protein
MSAKHVLIPIVSLLLFCLAGAVRADDDLVDDLADMPAGLNLPTAALVEDDIYVVSGYDVASGWTDAVYRYRIADDVWSTEAPGGGALAAIPTARTEACNTGMIAEIGAFCVIGGADGVGFTYGGPTDAVECYDPDANSWSNLEALPVAVTGAYCSVKDGVIYVTGGYSGAFNTALWWYDTADTVTAGWQTAPGNRPASSFNGRGALTRDPALGGQGEWRFSQFMGSDPAVTHFGLDSKTWLTGTANTDRVYSCVVPDGSFNTLILGGGDYVISPTAPYEATDEILSYSSIDDTWDTAEAALPMTWSGMTCVQDAEGNIYLFGGYSSDTKELSIGRRMKVQFLGLALMNRVFNPNGFAYMRYRLGVWTDLIVYLMWANQMYQATVEQADNGVARVKVPDTATQGDGRVLALNTYTLRQWDFDIQIGDDDATEPEKVLTDGFDLMYHFKLGLDQPVDTPFQTGTWDAEDDGPIWVGRLATRISFKKGAADSKADTAFAIEDPGAGVSGIFTTPLFPFESGEATVSWEMAMEDGDGLSMALLQYDSDLYFDRLRVDMLNGSLSMTDGESKAETDCSQSLSTGQWYQFELAMNLDTSTASLSVDGVETACQDVAIPFGESMPVSGVGFLLDDTAAGTTWLDNIDVAAEPEDTPGDDDSADDDSIGADDDDTAGTDDDDNDDEGGDDDDDDDGGCGC